MRNYYLLYYDSITRYGQNLVRKSRCHDVQCGPTSARSGKMKVSINEHIFSIIGNSDRADYLLTWVLGYVDRTNARNLSQVLDLKSLMGVSQCQIILSKNLEKSIREHSSENASLDFMTNWLLVVAILMGEGE